MYAMDVFVISSLFACICYFSLVESRCHHRYEHNISSQNALNNDVVCLLSKLNNANLKGNELEQAYRYFSLTPPMDPYYARLVECFTKLKSNCVLMTNLLYFRQTRWWMKCKTFRSPHDRQRDCNYNLSYSGHVNELTFKFTIHQYSCIIESSVPSGATFLAFGRTESELIACQVNSFFNNKYEVLCAFTRKERCMQLTVTLDYEHYDGYGEEISHGYNSLNYLVANRTFCSDTILVANPAIDLVESSRVQYFTGKWMNQSLVEEFKVAESSSQPQYEYYHSFRKYFSKEFPGLLREGVRGGFVYTPISTAIDKRRKFNPLDITRMYYFIGSAFLRRRLEEVVNYFNETSEGSRDIIEVLNMKSYGADKFSSVQFADDQSDLLRSLCQQVHRNYSLILQTGEQDLAYTPLQRVLNDALASRRLIVAMQSILNGSYPCPNLNHFIWVSSMPYPSCRRDLEYNENYASRGYRTNSAIAALNEQYFRSILETNIKEGLRVSIVDAYAIAYPRLAFHCADEMLTYKIRKTKKKDVKLTQTIGENAVFHSILDALSY